MKVNFKVAISVPFSAEPRRGKPRADNPKAADRLASRTPRIAVLMAMAIHMEQLLRDGVVADQAELAHMGHVTRARLTQIMNLLQLAPEVQEQLLFVLPPERERDSITDRQLRPIATELSWQRQMKSWGQLVFRDCARLQGELLFRAACRTMAGMAKQKASKSKPKKLRGPEPHWRIVEKVVALLEKALAPSAEVLHDQRLPNIATGHKRQCDVVVKDGKPPRRLTTIVEVQKRGRKVTIGNLGNWYKKMQAVGAHRLICVSSLDFPQSVKDEVAEVLGPVVVLMRLRELQDGNLPPGMLHSTMTYRVPSVTKHLTPHQLFYAESPQWPGGNTAGSDMRFFIGDSDEPLTIGELFENYFGRKPFPLPQGVHNVETEIGFGKTPVWSVYAGQRQRVLKLKSNLEVTMHVVEVPLVFSSYEHANVAGSLAWVAIASATIAGEVLQCKVCYVPQFDGTFKARVSFEGSTRGGFFGVPIAKPSDTL